jgi:molybdopterin-biosynthesis enzyme MoeA-like protein
VKTIAEIAKQCAMGSLSGIPSWMELMMKEVIKYHNEETIHDLSLI